VRRRTAAGGSTEVGRRWRALTALALACGALALSACGDDEETAPATGTTDAATEVETTTVPESVAPPPAGPESEPSGGISSDQPTDPDPEDVAPEDSEGGAGDEANDPIDDSGGSGGSGGGGSGSGSGGVSGKDAFEQFCEDNPRACE
jgi:uncharacterized membrane protein YgcG